MTSGSTQGIADDGPPTAHGLNVPSIFSLLAGGGSRSLEESMPSNCAQTDPGQYAARHNPQAYYVNLRSDCARYNVPLSDPLDLSARFTFVTPNLIHDMHDGTVSDGDNSGFRRSRLGHNSMLRATQEMLGLEPLLGAASTAADLHGPFNL